MKEKVSKVHPPAAFYPFQLHALPSAWSSCAVFPPFFTFSSYPASNHLASTMPCIPQNCPVGHEHCRHEHKRFLSLLRSRMKNSLRKSWADLGSHHRRTQQGSCRKFAGTAVYSFWNWTLQSCLMVIKTMLSTVKIHFCMLCVHVTGKKAVPAAVNVFQLVALVTLHKLLLKVREPLKNIFDMATF